MNGNRKTAREEAERVRKTPQISWFMAVLQPLASAVRVLSWPGFLILLVYLFVERHASGEQKQEIIDLYILGKGVNQHWALIVSGVVLALVLTAQHAYFRVRRLEHEPTRVDDSGNPILMKAARIIAASGKRGRERKEKGA